MCLPDEDVAKTERPESPKIQFNHKQGQFISSA